MKKVTFTKKLILLTLIIAVALLATSGLVLWLNSNQRKDSGVYHYCTDKQIRQMQYDPTYNPDCRDG